jgi:hypothetical protein
MIRWFGEVAAREWLDAGGGGANGALRDLAGLWALVVKGRPWRFVSRPIHLSGVDGFVVNTACSCAARTGAGHQVHDARDHPVLGTAVL